jgi:hypothetical protein
VVAINAGWRPTDAAALGRHGVRAVVLPGAGHFLMLEDPDGFNRLLAEVVDGFAQGEGGPSTQTTIDEGVLHLGRLKRCRARRHRRPLGTIG